MIAASPVPVITVVGHESDFTIADFVADLRAATPTAAAEMASAGFAEAGAALGRLRLALQRGMRDALQIRAQRVDRCSGRLLHPAGNENELEKFRRIGELSYIKESKRQALDFIVAQPGTFISLALKRVLYFWTGNSQLFQIFPLSGRFVTARYVFFTTVSVLAFVGLLFALRTRNPAVPLFTISLLVFPIVYYVAHPTPRYRHPIEPAMVVLAIYAIITIASKLFLSGIHKYRSVASCNFTAR